MFPLCASVRRTDYGTIILPTIHNSSEGVLETFQAQAVKETVAWQLAEAMRERKLTKKQLAEQMHTSRSQLDRVLDPAADNVTLETLQRAAELVGRRVKVELVAGP